MQTRVRRRLRTFVAISAIALTAAVALPGSGTHAAGRRAATIASDDPVVVGLEAAAADRPAAPPLSETPSDRPARIRTSDRGGRTRPYSRRIAVAAGD